MLDVKKSYEVYEKQIKPNKSIMTAINLMLSSEGVNQYAILQFIANNSQNGTTPNMLSKCGVDEELCSIILKEAENNGIVSFKFGKYYITDTGRSIITACHFRSLEILA